MKTEDLISVHISGKRWFQRTYGNTYHSVTVFLTFKNGETETLKSGMHGGYGNQYNQTAIEIFRNKFNMPKENYSNGMDKYPYLTSFCRCHNIPCTNTVSDVRREKDL